jgi:hypothetical protein
MAYKGLHPRNACNKYRTTASHTDIQGGFLVCVLGRPQLCLSQQPVSRLLHEDESACLMADNVWNEGVTIHRPQEVLTMLSSLHVDIFHK